MNASIRIYTTEDLRAAILLAYEYIEVHDYSKHDALYAAIKDVEDGRQALDELASEGDS